jgi:3-oxoacyl-[acyl-carrier protein] reductase
MTSLPIDDVCLTLEALVAVSDQRRPPSDQRVVRRADEPPRNGAQTEHLSRNGNQGSNGENMTPQNRDNPTGNGSENDSAGRVGPTDTFDPPAFDPPVFDPPVFDPATFDPGPDLPPLPTLRPLPTIRPLSRWSVESARPVRNHRRAPDVTEQDPSSPSDPEPAPQPARATADRPAQRVLVLGGSGAIGSAVARAMAAQGARVAVHHARNADGADDVVAALPGDGHLSVGADLADSEAVAALIRSVDLQFDGLDVVINAASAGESISRASVLGSSLADWTDAWTATLTVDVLGAATVAHAAAAAFRARGTGGRIILVAAKGRPSTGIGNPVGLAIEQAIGALGSVLASELVPHGIGVIVVGSGSVPSSGWSPVVLAETVAWLASGPTAGLPGAVINIAG